jgi:hypothetical protein
MSREVVHPSGLRARLFSHDRIDRSEKGDTMIEVLLALIVLGLTSVALIVAFSTTLSASAEHRSLTSADIAINDYSQRVIAGIEANQDLFTCPTPALSASANAAYYNTELAIASTAPYTATITSVQYWNPSTSQFTTSCIANASELITVSVSGGSSNQTTSFVVDSPTAGSNYVGGAPTGLTFLVPTTATSATSGASLPINPVVEVNFGNSPDATDLSPINLTLGDQNGNPTTAGTLSGCSSNDLNGIITYTGCTISLTTSSAQAVDFTLVASDPEDASLTPATSLVIAVSGSTSSYLSFTTQPAAGDSGAIMTTQPVIKAYLGGTTSTVDTSVMSITLTTSGSINGSYQLSSCGGTLNNSTTTEGNGVVTVTDSVGHGGTFYVSGCDFSGLFYYDVNSGAVGTPYTMTASSPNVTSATSQPFAATGYGAAAQMSFIVEPTGGIAATTAANTVTMNSFEVAIEDSWGNILSGQGQSPYAGSISVKITSTGTALTTCTPSSSGGIFTFSGCGAPLGSALTLTATATGSGSAGVTPEVSSAFNNTGPVAALVWYAGYPTSSSTAQPVAGASGSVMTNQPVLAYEDAGTNPGEMGHPEVVTADTTSVSYTSTYASGTESATSPNGILTTCSNLPPIDGIISAGNCTFVGLVGTNYTMMAATTSGPTITSANSSTFSPTGPGAPSQLVFSPSPGVEPVAAAAGSPFSTEPVVVVEDAGGNIVASASSQVEMNSYLYNSLSPTDPTVQGGFLLNCSTLAPVGGAVSLIPVSGYLDVEGSCAFGGTVGTNYQLVATSPGLTQAVSTNFTPTTFGPASVIAVSGCSPGVKWANTCVLSAAVQDAWGNTVTSFASGVTFADTGGSGTVSGLGTSTATSGVAYDTVTGTVVGPELISASEGALTSPQYSFNVNQDTTTATVSETPTSVVYGAESASHFTVTVVTGNHEFLPEADNVTVTVGGSATCVASVTPSGGGGTGTCSIANTALPYNGGTPYTVTATYGGDTDLSAAAPATAATGLTVTKDTTTATVSETPTSVVYGDESASHFTVTVVTGNNEIIPTTTDSAIVSVGSTTCTATIVPSGTGGSGTCSIANTALPYNIGIPNAVTATYSGDLDLSNSAATASTGLTVSKDTTTATVSENPTSVTYGSEASSTFTVTVVTGNNEILPTTDSAIVNVGGVTTCTVTIVPSGTGGSGTCKIGASALPSSATPYAVTAAYSGDLDLSTSAATASTGLTVTQATPVITWASPASIVYGTALGATQLDATASTAGTFVYSPASGTVLTAGSQTLSVTFTPTDTTDYTTATQTVSLTVTKATPVITWATPASIVYGTALSATQLDATGSVPGTFVYSPASGTVLTAGSHTLNVTFTPTDTTDYTTATQSVTLTVTQKTPTVTWATPASIVYGTALGATQLDATASTGGTFVYSPVSGTVLTVGTNQTLSVTFTPTDTTDYTTATKTVTITVTQATPVITWANPASIAYGTVLGATQLDATASTAGTFVYNPVSGTVLPVGTNQTLSVTFTPTDTTDYTTATKTATITVTKATPVITWANPASITYGTLLGSTQLDATASTAGTFVYNPVSGTELTVGANQTLSVTFTPTNTTDYTSTVGTAHITVTQDSSTVIVSESPTSVAYGSEASTTFTVDVNPANGENLPLAQDVTVNVDGGAATCTADVAITTTGTCTIANTALPASGTAYSVTATFTGDTDISASPTATAATGLTITQFTPTVTITNTTNPSGVGAGNLVLTGTVTGATGGAAPTGTLDWTVEKNGSAYGTCTVSTLTAGSGLSTATCTLPTPAVGNYTATATYVPGADPNYLAASTLHTFGLYLGSSSTTPLPNAADDYLIDGSTAGTGAPNSSDYLQVTVATTITSVTGFITTAENGNPSPSATFTVGTGNTTFAATVATCNVAKNVDGGSSCIYTGSVVIAANSYVDLMADRLVASDTFNGWWIVTYTQ